MTRSLVRLIHERSSHPPQLVEPHVSQRVCISAPIHGLSDWHQNQTGTKMRVSSGRPPLRLASSARALSRMPSFFSRLAATIRRW
jgi:hypothetical protein